MRVNKKNIQGLSLVEVLVTSVLLGVGLLGASALQLAGLKGTDSAHYRTIATFLANDMAERMRMNLPAIAAGDYRSNPDQPIGCQTSPQGYKNCNANACNPAELALFDTVQVQCGFVQSVSGVIKSSGGVEKSLPNGHLTISCPDNACNATSQYTINVAWIPRDENDIDTYTEGDSGTYVIDLVIRP